MAGIRSDGRRQSWSNAAPQRFFHVDDPEPPPADDSFGEIHFLPLRHLTRRSHERL